MTPRADPTLQARRHLERWQLAADPDDLDARLAGVARALEEARATADGPLVADAWRLHLMTQLESEKIAEINASLGELDRWCQTRPDPACRRVLDWLRGLRAILDGQPAQAEALLATSVTDRQALGPLTTIRWFQGRFYELEARYLQVRRDEPAESSHVLMLAWIWAQQDRKTAARGALDTLGDIQALTRDRDWLLRMSVLAELSVLLDDRSLAEAVRRMLSPYPRRIVLIGNGFGCWGTTDRPLGLLSRYLGHTADAVRHLTAKIELSAAAGAHPWLVRGQFDLAEVLLDAGGSHLAEAQRYAREGIMGARRLDYPLLWARAEALERRLLVRATSAPRRPSNVTEAAARAAIEPTITVLGGFEVRAATGEVTTWTSRKARELLCILVTFRGRPVSRELLMEHLWPGQPPSRLRNRLAVAVSTVRRALDPGTDFGREHFIGTTRDTVRLNTDHVAVDAERFLRAGAAALARGIPASGKPARSGESGSGTDSGEQALAEHALSDSLRYYRGEAFAHEPFAEWATALRDECAAMQVALLHAVIATSSSSWGRAEAARQILATDPYDERANRALVDALQTLGARGVAESTQAKFDSSLD
jgi:DNA-binding SARP family transcriptional activator